MQKSYHFLKMLPFLFFILLPVSGQTTEATDDWCANFGVECPDVSSPEKLALAISGGFDEFGESNLLIESNKIDNTPPTTDTSPLNEQDSTDEEDDADPNIECPSEPILLEKGFTLQVGDEAITQKFLGEQNNSEFLQAPNGEMVTLLESMFEPNGDASITFEPREAGKTQFIIGNCFQQTVVTIEVLEPVIETCQMDLAFPLQAEQANITMHTGETRIVWFTGGQTKRWLATPPASEIITLESPEFPEAGGAKLTLMALQVGTTQLAISDCGETAVIDITVVDEERICSASPLKPNQQDITLVLGESAITPTFMGDEVNLTEPPDDAVVTLDLPIYSEQDITQLKLTPRQVGKTQLMLSNCASEAMVNITVIKPNSLAYFCGLANKTTDICDNPNYQQALIFNSFGSDAKGEPIETNAYFDGFINTGDDSIQDNLIIGQTDKASAHFNIIVDETHIGIEADLILYAQRQANNGKPSQFFMYNGKTWQEWDGDDISSLVTTKHYNEMPLITELTAKLNSLLQYNTSGEFALTVGYRLQNGFIIFSDKTIRFWIANSDAYPSPIKTRAYFASTIQQHDRNHRTQPNVTVTIQIKPDKQDMGQKADIILVALVSIEGEIYRYMQMPNKTWTNWNGEMEQLATIGNMVLINNLKIEIVGDLTHISDDVMIYIGYRMADNEIVFNGMEPIVVTMP